jgi:GNAT superfamily N-acetyltransferase
MSSIVVTRATPGMWEGVRDLRLAALKESPGAFGSTYERECNRTEAEWRERLGSVTSATFIGALDGVPAGLAGGYSHEPGSVELVSMWAEPAARGTGLAGALIDAVVGWAGDQGATSVHLWVVRGNDVAERAYARHGFVLTDEVQPLPHSPCVDEIGMRLELVAADAESARI